MCQVFAPESESEREERAELVRRKEEGRQCTNMDGCRAAFPRPVRRSVGGDKEREQGQGSSRILWVTVQGRAVESGIGACFKSKPL